MKVLNTLLFLFTALTCFQLLFHQTCLQHAKTKIQDFTYFSMFKVVFESCSPKVKCCWKREFPKIINLKALPKHYYNSHKKACKRKAPKGQKHLHGLEIGGPPPFIMNCKDSNMHMEHLAKENSQKNFLLRICLLCNITVEI